MAIRDDLVKRATRELETTLHLRDTTAGVRAMNEVATPSIAICLGYGRCGLPSQGADVRTCGFCMQVGPNVRPEDVPALVRKFVGGN